MVMGNEDKLYSYLMDGGECIILTFRVDFFVLNMRDKLEQLSINYICDDEFFVFCEPIYV